MMPAGGFAPPRTYNHSAFIYRDSLYVFGGYGSDGEECGPGTGHRHSELYEYSFESNRWSLVPTKGKKPSARLGHTINFVNGSLFLYGGWDRNGYRSDLHYIHFGLFSFSSFPLKLVLHFPIFPLLLKKLSVPFLTSSSAYLSFLSSLYSFLLFSTFGIIDF